MFYFCIVISFVSIFFKKYNYCCLNTLKINSYHFVVHRQDSLIGEKLQTIEGIATAFQLKMQTTSDGNRFRLTVDVVYDMRDIGRLRECLVSSPFRVDSNRAKMPSRLLQAAQQAGDDSELAQLRRQVATLASDKVYCCCVCFWCFKPLL